MGVKVKTQLVKDFYMPAACVACGAEAAPGAKWKVRGSRNEQKRASRGSPILELEFPLCAECLRASRLSWPLRVAGWLGIPMVGLVAFLGTGMAVSGLVSKAIDIALACLAAFLFMALCFYGVRKVGHIAAQVGIGAGSPGRSKAVQHCARIRRYGRTLRGHPHVWFEFENPDFARAFAELNHGILIA